MKAPRATYRLQFRGDMDFAAAVEIVPYLKDLGISHLYASPIFAATPGSSHGYDVTNHNQIDPALGGRAGFERLCDMLKAEGIGLILDIVPNHMAASIENPWWRDVIEWGEQSRFARHFDIDWSTKLTIPILGRPFEEALAEGELSLVIDGELGSLAMVYFDNLLPLHPASWEQVLAKLDHPAAAALAESAGRSDPAQPQWLREKVHEALAGSGGFAENLKELSRDRAFLASLHEQQPWQLMFWKDARRNLSYRRFFEITGLVGVRVEDRPVFEDVHCLTLELVRTGQVDGLRIDHVDGLADPAAYLRMLREAAGPDTYIIVEKILAPDEALPADWPVQGTTGYEFIDAVVDLLADADGVEKLSVAYEESTGAPALHVARRQAKTEIVTVNFEGELGRLTTALVAIAAGRFDFDELQDGLVALIVAMPIYRTYVGESAASEADRAAFEGAIAEMRATDPGIRNEIVDFLRGVLVKRESATEEVLLARRLFQQLSSPAMAKGVEDTQFYRDHRLLALNEVGCEPERPSPSLDRFHHFMVERQERFPLSLSATATHDTKRGEDARARLLALTSAPEKWADLMSRWRAGNSRLVRDVGGSAAPEPEVEWMIYQSLMAAWPEELDPADVDGVAALRTRLLAFVEKAVREAKFRTSWTEVDGAYEAAVRDYAERLLQEQGDFLIGFVRDTEPFRASGHSASLSQLLVKLTAPGIPDIYQGTEIGDFSFVDPDNRRPVDFKTLQDLLRARRPPSTFLEWKMRILAVGLAARRDRADLFSKGDYIPLDMDGTGRSRIVAYARIHEGEAAIVLVPRIVLDEVDDVDWADTIVRLHPGLEERSYCECLSGRRMPSPLDLPVREILAGQPCALILTERMAD